MSEETKDKSPSDEEQEKAYALPKIDFSTFVLSINSAPLKRVFPWGIAPDNPAPVVPTLLYHRGRHLRRGRFNFDITKLY